MKVLFLADDVNNLSVAYALQRENLELDVYVQNNVNRTGDGLLNIIDSWRPCLKDADLVVCDGTSWGTKYEVLRGVGRPILCCDAKADIANENKDLKTDVLNKLMIPYSDDSNMEGHNFRIQGWWNGRAWVEPFIYSFNYNTFFPSINGFYPSDFGPNVDSMGNVSFASRGRTKLSKETIAGLDEFLVKTKFKGPVTMDVLITDSVVFVKDFHIGFTPDSVESIIECLDEPFSDLVFETAYGVKKEIKFRKDFVVSVRFTIPPYPLGKNNSLNLTEIGGINEQNLKHIHFSDMRMDDGKYISGTYNGLALKVTAMGKSVGEATRRAYRTINNLDAEGKQYRTDIGSGFKEIWTDIQSWGWA